MSRSDDRTSEAWHGFDRWATWIVPILLAVPAILGWQSGVGNDAACCTDAAAATVAPAAVVAPSVTPPAVIPEAVTPPTATPPVAATPAIDCASTTAGANIAFAVNKATLTDAGRQALDQVIVCLKAGNYDIVGHTDSDGDAAFSQQLSVARANSARSYLMTRGVAADRLKAIGMGETSPIADNATVEGKAKNRRLAFRPR